MYIPQSAVYTVHSSVGCVHSSAADVPCLPPPNHMESNTDQTDQELQQLGPSPCATHAFQWARVSLTQQAEGEFISFSSRPPASVSAAAKEMRQPKRKPNKRREEKQSLCRERCCSQRVATAGSQQQQQQLQAPGSSNSSSNGLPRQTFKLEVTASKGNGSSSKRLAAAAAEMVCHGGLLKIEAPASNSNKNA